MSYIRSLSNPEAMYAYGSGGLVYISANTLTRKNGSHIEMSMPGYIFEGLLRRWKKNLVDTRYRGASLLEIKPREQRIETLLRSGMKPANAYQWRLSYKNWGKKTIVAFQVTWFYVAGRL